MSWMFLSHMAVAIICMVIGFRVAVVWHTWLDNTEMRRDDRYVEHAREVRRKRNERFNRVRRIRPERD